MSGDDWDQLLVDAREALREQQEAGDVNASLGENVTPLPGDHFAGRWRGDGQMATKQGTIDVYLVWSQTGAPGFLYQHTRLVQEVEADRPEFGDRVLVLRGETEEFEKDGEIREIFPYVLRREPCQDPLPTEAPAAAAAVTEDEDELPF
jgi:hypothetical protein